MHATHETETDACAKRTDPVLRDATRAAATTNLRQALSRWDAPIDGQADQETLFASYGATADSPGHAF